MEDVIEEHGKLISIESARVISVVLGENLINIVLQNVVGDVAHEFRK